MSSDCQRIVVISCIHRLRRNIILHQPWNEIHMEDWACMARDHIKFCHPVIAMYVNIPEDIILKRERFVAFMLACCRTMDDMHDNRARIILFSQMSRNIENIPPTQATVDQHIKRTSYQSEHEQSVEVQPELPDVTGWGWETPQTAGYVPTWTTLCIAKVACLELIACTWLSIAMGISIVSRQTWNAPHFVNVVEPAISRRLEL